MKKTLLLLMLLAISYCTGFSQKPPVIYGKVPKEDLMMKTYDRDTSAVAVILADYGWLDKTSFEFTRTLRIKILKKAGLSLADFKYRTMEKPAIKGTTYNMVNGEVVKTKLSSSSVFIKALSDGSNQISLAMPDIKEGSVFDLQITWSGLPYSWYFQSSVPVRWSEIYIPYSPYVEFNKNFFGYLPFTVATSERWAVANAPAFKSEPFINSPENYMSKVEIEISAIKYPGYWKTYANSWEAVNQTLTQSKYFPSDNQLALCAGQMVDELKAIGKEGDELMKAAFEAVKKEGFNGENNLFISDEGLCNHFKSGSGSSADINFMLLQVLKKLGFDVYPVALSTRANGILSTFNPSIDKFNYIVVGVKNGTGFTLLDATEKYLPYNLLPDRTINGNGRIISETYSNWIPVVSKGKDKSECRYDLILNKDLSLTGKVTKVYTDYAAYDFRRNYSSFNNSDEMARQMEKNNPGLTINQINISDMKDIYKPVTVSMDVKIEGLANMIDNEVYVNPMLFEQIKDNPFNAAERVYPISFSRLEDTNIEVNINLPEGFSPEVMPKTAASKTKNNSLNFNYSATATANQVNIKYTFSKNSLTILQDQYKDVRNIYNNLISKQAEPIILKVL